MWVPAAQPGLWFTGGPCAQCRIYSKYQALQLKAALLTPRALKAPSRVRP